MYKWIIEHSWIGESSLVATFHRQVQWATCGSKGLPVAYISGGMQSWPLESLDVDLWRLWRVSKGDIDRGLFRLIYCTIILKQNNCIIHVYSPASVHVHHLEHHPLDVGLFCDSLVREAAIVKFFMATCLGSVISGTFSIGSNVLRVNYIIKDE